MIRTDSDADPMVGLPWPARRQGTVDSMDLTLRRVARQRHPSVLWWWNQRQTEHGFGALCYCCDQLITTWDRRWPCPDRAVEEVMRHRRDEFERWRDGLIRESLTNAARRGRRPDPGPTAEFLDRAFRPEGR